MDSGDRHVCIDCGVELTRKPGKGAWPKRCPEHKAEAARRNHAARGRKIRAEASAVPHDRSKCDHEACKLWYREQAATPHYCVDCGVEVQRGWKQGRWPERCSAHQLERDHQVHQIRKQQRRVDNPEKARAADRAWAAANPDKITHKNHARRVATTGADAEFIELAVLIERDGTKCLLCHREIDMALPWPDRRCKTLEHVIPIAKGGSHTYANVTLAHAGCNSSKGVRDGVNPAYAVPLDDPTHQED